MSAEINSLRREINNLLDDEELYWGQRSKAHWLRKGDKNTKFFHAQASERRKQNTILGLWNNNGVWSDENESLVQVATSYFEALYTTSNLSNIEETTTAILTRVIEKMNTELAKDFTREEMVAALKQIHPTKALGPNGMSAMFYQKYWSIISDSVVNIVLNVLNHNLLIGDLNKTNIALVPKTKNPKRMTKFRLISLCNVIYKLISKTVTNRLKALLPQLILENQSAFTSDLLITDNVLVAFKLMHYLNHKT